MAQDHKLFPNIAKAALEMAYDNGGIHRGRGEAVVLARLDELLGSEGVYMVDLHAIDTFIGKLSEEDLQTLVAGEETDMVALQALYSDPEKLSGLMDDIFNEVI